MSDTVIKIEVAEISKLNLEPGDVLMVKLVGDYFMDADMKSLSDSFKPIFPNNKVMVCVLPTGNDMQLEVVKPETKEPEPSGCSVASYCDNCSCGKREKFEALNELTKETEGLDLEFKYTKGAKSYWPMTAP